MAARWYWVERSLAGQVKRAREMLSGVEAETDVKAVLDRWETETRAGWEPRTEEFITYLYERHPGEDLLARRLLRRVCGADYGSRPDDWERWYDARQQIAQGLPLTVPRRQRVRLEPRWVAPIGLTAWFTTILSLDGHIFVASLGHDFDDPTDEADGLIVVDGTTGDARYFFTPPREHRGPRDVIGVAAGDECLFVGCRNGSVYCLGPRGDARWHTHAGSALVCAPLATDTNRDGVTDVIVATGAGKVVALSGRHGRTTWVTDIADSSGGEDLLGTTLTLGDMGPDALRELIVTTPPGGVRVLAVRDGRVRWQTGLAAGTVAGAICAAESPLYVADRAAAIWSLNPADQLLECVWVCSATRSREATLVAGLRTLDLGSDTPSLLVACPTGDYRSRAGAVAALNPDGIRWRLPIGGAIWGTPAVADLNQDGQLEIVVASIEPGASGESIGVLSIVSSTGHCLHRQVFAAPIECSPVVADVDGDNYLDVLVADQSGRLHCFATEGHGPVEWGLFGGDSHNTRNGARAYAYGQVPFGFQWQWRGEE